LECTSVSGTSGRRLQSNVDSLANADDTELRDVSLQALADDSGMRLTIVVAWVEPPAPRFVEIIDELGTSAFVAVEGFNILARSTAVLAGTSISHGSAFSGATFFDLIAQLQFIALTGQLNVPLPSWYLNFTANFAWSNGHIPSISNLLEWYFDSLYTSVNETLFRIDGLVGRTEQIRSSICFIELDARVNISGRVDVPDGARRYLRVLETTPEKLWASNLFMTVMLLIFFRILVPFSVSIFMDPDLKFKKWLGITFEEHVRRKWKQRKRQWERASSGLDVALLRLSAPGIVQACFMVFRVPECMTYVTALAIVTLVHIVGFLGCWAVFLYDSFRTRNTIAYIESKRMAFPSGSTSTVGTSRGATQAQPARIIKTSTRESKKTDDDEHVQQDSKVRKKTLQLVLAWHEKNPSSIKEQVHLIGSSSQLSDRLLCNFQVDAERKNLLIDRSVWLVRTVLVDFLETIFVSSFGLLLMVISLCVSLFLVASAGPLLIKNVCLSNRTNESILERTSSTLNHWMKRQWEVLRQVTSKMLSGTRYKKLAPHGPWHFVSHLVHRKKSGAKWMSNPIFLNKWYQLFATCRKQSVWYLLLDTSIRVLVSSLSSGLSPDDGDLNAQPSLIFCLYVTHLGIILFLRPYIDERRNRITLIQACSQVGSLTLLVIIFPNLSVEALEWVEWAIILQGVTFLVLSYRLVVSAVTLWAIFPNIQLALSGACCCQGSDDVSSVEDVREQRQTLDSNLEKARDAAKELTIRELAAKKIINNPDIFEKDWKFLTELSRKGAEILYGLDYERAVITQTGIRNGCCTAWLSDYPKEEPPLDENEIRLVQKLIGKKLEELNKDSPSETVDQKLLSELISACEPLLQLWAPHAIHPDERGLLYLLALDSRRFAQPDIQFKQLQRSSEKFVNVRDSCGVVAIRNAINHFVKEIDSVKIPWDPANNTAPPRSSDVESETTSAPPQKTAPTCKWENDLVPVLVMLNDFEDVEDFLENPAKYTEEHIHCVLGSISHRVMYEVRRTLIRKFVTWAIGKIKIGQDRDQDPPKNALDNLMREFLKPPFTSKETLKRKCEEMLANVSIIDLQRACEEGFLQSVLKSVFINSIREYVETFEKKSLIAWTDFEEKLRSLEEEDFIQAARDLISFEEDDFIQAVRSTKDFFSHLKKDGKWTTKPQLIANLSKTHKEERGEDIGDVVHKVLQMSSIGTLQAIVETDESEWVKKIEDLREKNEKIVEALGTNRKSSEWNNTARILEELDDEELENVRKETDLQKQLKLFQDLSMDLRLPIVQAYWIDEFHKMVDNIKMKERFQSFTRENIDFALKKLNTTQKLRMAVEDPNYLFEKLQNKDSQAAATPIDPNLIDVRIQKFMEDKDSRSGESASASLCWAAIKPVLDFMNEKEKLKMWKALENEKDSNESWLNALEDSNAEASTLGQVTSQHQMFLERKMEMELFNLLVYVWFWCNGTCRTEREITQKESVQELLADNKHMKQLLKHKNKHIRKLQEEQKQVEAHLESLSEQIESVSILSGSTHA